MADGRRGEGGEALREGVRAVVGVLSALRDAVADTVDEVLKAPGGAGTGAASSTDPTDRPRDASPIAPRESTEQPWSEDPPLVGHPEWAAEMPWLMQGTSFGGPDGTFDLGLSGATPVGEALGRWRSLKARTGAHTVVHARQVHGGEVRTHRGMSEGILVADGYDGHVTAEPGVLLTVSVADCVPVSVVDPAHRAVALLHAGWRGAAAGILEAGIERLGREFGSRAAELRVHFGPSICGRCYEVGPEVHEALGLPRPGGPTPVDLRAVLTGRAVAMGVPQASVTASAHCTRCGSGGFFSHRGGQAGRQMGILGIARGR